MWRCGVTRFFKVEMAADGWGLLVNEGTAEVPRFRVVMKGSQQWMESLAADLNAGGDGLARIHADVHRRTRTGTDGVARPVPADVLRHD